MKPDSTDTIHFLTDAERITYLLAEVERLQREVDHLTHHHKAIADRDRLRGMLKALSLDWERVINEHTPALSDKDEGLCSGLGYARAALADTEPGGGE